MNILIIGANSAIARATARRYATAGNRFCLLGRDSARLDELARDLVIRGARDAQWQIMDAAEADRHGEVIEAAATALGTIDLALIAHGSLPDQEAAAADAALALRAIQVNGLSYVALLTALAQRMLPQGAGTIVAITSVAGDRGRRPNYVYGAAKAMVSVYLQGLRGRLHAHGIHVIDIRPGPVDSPMTAQLPKGALWSTPEAVAAKIARAVTAGRHTVYVPGFWRPIMFVLRHLPELLAKRLRF